MEDRKVIPMPNQKSNRCRDMFGRVGRFFAENPTLTLGARSIAQVAVVNTSAAAIDTLAIQQAAGRGESIGGTTSRDLLAVNLRGVLRDMQLTAESFDPVLFPGATDVFRVPRSQSYAVLLATAGAFVEALPTYEAAFLEREYPVGFATDLITLMAGFATATERQVDGQQRRAGGTHGLTQAMKRGRAAVKELNAAVRKKLRTTNPALYKVWLRASRIESAPVPATPRRACK
jgi:hypothetical protein